MSDYRIQKVQHHVEVTLANGQRLEGAIFLQAFARFRAGPELPLDALNDGDLFLALRLDSGEVVLVQKAQIAVVQTDLPEDDTEASVVGMRTEFALANGTTCSGSIFPELRADRPRLVDFLNDTPLKFIPLFAAEHLLLVSRAHIAYARPVS